MGARQQRHGPADSRRLPTPTSPSSQLSVSGPGKASWGRAGLELARGAAGAAGERMLSRKPDFSARYRLSICSLIKCVAVLAPRTPAARTSREP